ncbi:MAG TPA: PDZ domain-containing protein, partial [Syntrophorhabdaceae bacterium]|nr:PDZ domain-containing protein [Syntrophorhabdaceae bacterium]
AVSVANGLLAHGKVERGSLGISIQDMTEDAAKSVHAQTATGALIVDVVKGGPADKAGLKKNDVVIGYGDKQIPDSATLRNDVAETHAGEQVKLTIIRNGQKMEITATIGSTAETEATLAATVKQRIGAEVRLPTPKEIERYGLNQGQGVVILRLDAKGPLAEAGFEVKDMILSVDGQSVDGIDGFNSLVGALPQGKRISFTALDHRRGNTGNIFVVIR